MERFWANNCSWYKNCSSTQIRSENCESESTELSGVMFRYMFVTLSFTKPILLV